MTGESIPNSYADRIEANIVEEDRTATQLEELRGSVLREMTTNPDFDPMFDAFNNEGFHAFRTREQVYVTLALNRALLFAMGGIVIINRAKETLGGPLNRSTLVTCASTKLMVGRSRLNDIISHRQLKESASSLVKPTE